MNEQGAASGARAKCVPHGLMYDPAVQQGCVLCRKSSAPPPPSIGAPASLRKAQAALSSAAAVGSSAVGGMREAVSLVGGIPWKMTGYLFRGALTLFFLVVAGANEQVGALGIGVSMAFGGMLFFMLFAALFKRLRGPRAMSYVAVVASFFVVVQAAGRRRDSEESAARRAAAPGAQPIAVSYGPFDVRQLPKLADPPPGATLAVHDEQDNVLLSFEVDGVLVPSWAKGQGLVDYAKLKVPSEVQVTWGETTKESPLIAREGSRTNVEVTLAGRRYVGLAGLSRTSEHLRILFILSPAERPQQLQPLIAKLRSAALR